MCYERPRKPAFAPISRGKEPKQRRYLDTFHYSVMLLWFSRPCSASLTPDFRPATWMFSPAAARNLPRYSRQTLPIREMLLVPESRESVKLRGS